MDNKRELIAGSERMIAQLQNVLRQLDAEVYTHPLEVLEGHSLGQHFRHVLEFYQCLLSGCKSGAVDYSARKRDALLENRPEKARQALGQVRAHLRDLNTERPLEVRSDLSLDPVRGRELCRSSIGRELMYAFDHAVHHLAIIRIGLRSAFPHIELEREVGVAPATLRHRKSC